jgi:hypothetical protein
MSFGLNDFKPSEGNYVSKIMLPGTHECKLLDLKLEAPPYDKSQYNLIFVLEGPDLGEDFKGLAINRLDPSKGNYKGQIASVRSGQYGYKDWVYNGKDIKRDESIQNFLGGFLTQVGLLEEFKTLGIEADTIEELVTNVKNFIVSKNTTFAFTIAGQKYFKDGSEYPNYSLFLPKKVEGKFPFAATLEDEKLLPFNEAVHITEKGVAASTPSEIVEGFAPAAQVFTEPPVTQPVMFEEKVNDLNLP